ncbi:hypothetical protein OGAPHI_004388 [Ogataea philodendri]|uniref:Nodulin-like domain-containing protein n=1 Tax=Ogataea philodendri TaxID=1378263 RepID=A0A9P8T5D4_9ASCO|nr:uncharacterized protein OGAPHI_004388 [Ogataea philodendri]KAH3666199.1 hypothetical protein OGAPHI_004388 [Ogataea philodendri]
MPPSSLVVAACAIASLNCGTLYIFGAFSPQVSAQLHYTAAQTSRIAIAGQSAAILSGPFVGRATDVLGYTGPCAIGAFLISLSYYLFYRQFAAATSSLAYSCVLFAFVGVGSTGLNTVCVKCSMVTWSSRKGLAAALPIACYGASGVLYSRLGSWLAAGDTAGFLKIVAFVSMGISVITTPFVCLCDWKRTYVPAPTTPTTVELQSLSSPTPATPHSKDPPRHAFQTKDFWYVAAVLGLLSGIGQMFIYGLGVIVCSLYGGSELAIKDINAYDVAVQEHQHGQVSLLSLCSTAGRLLGGLIADEFHSRTRTSRASLLLIPLFLIGAVQIGGYFFVSLRELSILTVGLGLGYGALYTLTPLVVSDLWGMKNFSTNWGLCNTSPAVTNLVLSTVFARNYDSHTVPVEIDGETRAVCELGYRCYNRVFAATFALCITASLFLWQLVARSSHQMQQKRRPSI